MFRSKAWFKENLYPRAGEYEEPISLEYIKQKDLELKMKKDALTKEVESMQAHMNSLDFEEKNKFLAKMSNDFLNGSWFISSTQEHIVITFIKFGYFYFYSTLSLSTVIGKI